MSPRVVTERVEVDVLGLLWMLACSPCSEGETCRVDGGRYVAVAPEGKGPYPVMLFFHGYSNSADGVKDKRTVVPWRDAGYLTVFPDGKNGSWAHVGSPDDSRDELSFIEDVLDDVAERYDLTGRVVATGFSQGSSMAWDLACYRPERVTALVGASGSFWVPEPSSCDGAVPVRHTHGLNDNIMPMEGRPIGSYDQGDVYEGIDAWKATNGCVGEPVVEVDGEVSCEVWTCATDEVRLCMHDGKHGVPSGWAERSMGWVDEVAGR